MIEEHATVVAIKNNNITVASELQSTCSGCMQVDNCGSGQIAKAFPQKRLSITIKSDLPLQLGDKVIIGLNESALLSSAWQVYLWPLFGLLFFGWLGQWMVEISIFPHESIAVLFTIFGGYIGFLLAQHQQSKANNCAELAPKILRHKKQNITISEIPD